MNEYGQRKGLWVWMSPPNTWGIQSDAFMAARKGCKKSGELELKIEFIYQLWFLPQNENRFSATNQIHSELEISVFAHHYS